MVERAEIGGGGAMWRRVVLAGAVLVACGGSEPAGTADLAALPSVVVTIPTGAPGAVSPEGGACPPGYPIKGNTTSNSGEWIYHVPGGQYFDVTKPEVCFNSEADAQAAGFRRSLR